MELLLSMYRKQKDILQFEHALTESTFFNKDAQPINRARLRPESVAIKG